MLSCTALLTTSKDVKQWNLWTAPPVHGEKTGWLVSLARAFQKTLINFPGNFQATLLTGVIRLEFQTLVVTSGSLPHVAPGGSFIKKTLQSPFHRRIFHLFEQWGNLRHTTIYSRCCKDKFNTQVKSKKLNMQNQSSVNYVEYIKCL